MNPNNHTSLELSQRLVAAKEIPLSRGMVTIVDADDYEWLSQWKWSTKTGRHCYYAFRSPTINGERITVSMHREILEMDQSDKRKGDHRDRNGLNNRRANLRIADNFMNAYNCRMQRSNTSGYRGVSWYEQTNKWIAYIKADGRQKHCGYYKTALEAAIAHDVESIKQYGSNAMLNFSGDNQ